MNAVQRIEALFDRWGGRLVAVGPHGPLSLREHSLRCAGMARWICADDALVASALLHDLGHLLAAASGAPEVRLHPEIAAVRFLAHDFGPAVLEPIRLKTDAQRCLAGIDPWTVQPAWSDCWNAPAPRAEPMPPAEGRRFAASAHGARAVLLSRLDRMALVPGTPTPDLAPFLVVLERNLDEPPVMPRHVTRDPRRGGLRPDRPSVPPPHGAGAPSTVGVSYRRHVA